MKVQIYIKKSFISASFFRKKVSKITHSTGRIPNKLAIAIGRIIPFWKVKDRVSFDNAKCGRSFYIFAFQTNYHLSDNMYYFQSIK